MENKDHIKTQFVFLNLLWELKLLFPHSAQTLQLQQGDIRWVKLILNLYSTCLITQVLLIPSPP